MQRIAIIGLGKIACDQHVPAIVGDTGFELVATVDPIANGTDDVPHFASLGGMLASGIAVDCAAICTPPQHRFAVAREALGAGLDLLLEKPPCAALDEARELATLAQDRVLFAAWHSRFAAGVEAATHWLADRAVQSATIRWREDVRKWHPGQDWIFETGGLGVFDPAINALSILTQLLPGEYRVQSAQLERPANFAMPICGTGSLVSAKVADSITLDLDFLEPDGEIWDIDIVCANGETLRLSKGGAALAINGAIQPVPDHAEYAGVYRRFALLLEQRQSEFDLQPLAIALDMMDKADWSSGSDFHF